MTIRSLLIVWTAVITEVFAVTNAVSSVADIHGAVRDPIGQVSSTNSSPLLASARLPEGIQAEVVVTAPLVSRPIDMDFDAEGYLWVLEAVGERNGRIVRLADTDGDGGFDARRVYLGNLAIPGSILVQGAGVYVEQPDGVIWLEDDDGDGSPETRVQVFKADPKADRSHGKRRRLLPDEPDWGGPLFANIDHWIYCPRLRLRIKPLPGRPRQWMQQHFIDSEASPVCADGHGNLIHLDSDLGIRTESIPFRFLHRNPNHTPQSLGGRGYAHRDQAFGPSRIRDDSSPGDKHRIARRDSMREIGLVGAAVCRSDLLPSPLQGVPFVCDPEHGVILRHRPQNGVDVASAGASGAWDTFMASEAGRFTPFRLKNGPDGALYVLNLGDKAQFWSRSTRRSGKDLSSIRSVDLSRGSILRLRTNGSDIRPAKIANALQPWEVAARFIGGRAFWQDWACHHWVEQSSPASTRILEEWVSDHQRLVGNRDSTPAAIRLRALWVLEGQGALSAKILCGALEDPDPRVRSAALHIIADHSPGPMKEEAMNWVLHRSASFPHSVLPSLLICLGSDATPKNDSLMASILLSAQPSELLEDAAISGLEHRELDFLRRLLADPRCGAPKASHARLLRHLGRCLQTSGKQSDMDQARHLVRELPETDWRVMAINDGLLGFSESPGKSDRRSTVDQPRPEDR